MPGPQPVCIIGRYALFDPIASGGMATVHLGRLMGEAGFARTVAVKRLHPHFARDEEFSRMLVDEARIVARIRHPNVVQTLDVVSTDGELFVVMDYVHGDSLARLLSASAKKGSAVPPAIAAAIVASVLHGLHAAHEATDELGNPLGIVHRDISPQNILVGLDGIARVLDFGVAKAAGRLQTTTRQGVLKGKLPYMSPEQIRGEADRASDVYACAVVLWEALAGRRLFTGDNDANVLARVLEGAKEPPSRHAPVPPELDAIAMRGLAPEGSGRFATAREMARALEKTTALAPPSDVGEWLERLVGDAVARRGQQIKDMEAWSVSAPVSGPVRVQGVERTDSRPEGAGSVPGESREHVTTVSGASVAALAAGAGGLRRRALVVAAAIALLAGSLGTFLVVRWTRGPEGAPAPSAAASAGSVEVQSPPAASPAPTVSPAASATAEASAAAASASVAAPAAVPPPDAGHAIRPKRRPKTCDPPFIDDPVTGKRRWKPECFR